MPDAPPSVHPLASVPYFGQLSPETLDAIAAAAVQRRYARGEVVFLEGEPCAGLYVLLEGWLRVVKASPAGREQVVRFVAPGESFGEFSVFIGAPNPATVVALEDAVVWLIGREAILGLLERHADLCRAVIEVLALRTQYLVDLVEDLSLRSVEARLARFILDEARDGVLHRRRWATQAELAARIGTVLDVLNRALGALVDEGLIRMDRRRITILDRESLEARAAG